MIIKKINISSFGKLKDFSLTPSPGLNVIYAPNESGKTTLLSFIKYIFYGTKQKKQAGKLSFKEKYTPWDMSLIGGSCEIENDGMSYIIQRNETEHSSKVSVFCKDTGENVNISNPPGIHFMSIGERAFTDSCFITDIASLSDSSDGELVSFLADSCDDKSTYSKIRQSLNENILRLISDKRKSSSLSIINAQIMQNEDRLNIVNQKINTLQNEVDSLLDAEKTIDNLTRETDILKKQQIKTGYHKLIEEEKNLTDEKQKLLKTYEDLNNSIDAPSDIEISPADEAILTDDFAEIKHFLSRLKNALTKNIFMLFSILLIFFAFFFSGIAYLKYALPLFVIPFYLFGVSAFKLFKKLNAENKKYKLLRYNQSFLMTKYNLKTRRECIEYISLLKNKKNSYFASREQKSYLLSHIERIDTLLEKCRASIENMEKNSLSEISAEFDDINFFTNRDINGIIYENENKLKELSLNLTLNLHKKEELSVLKADAASITEEIECQKKEKESIIEKADIYQKALLILDNAFANAKNTFFPSLSLKTAEIFSFITSHEDLIVNSNDKFDLSITKSGYVRSASFLSRGALDALYFSLRLAIIDIMSENGTVLPLYLDDVFANCDDKRTIALLELIYKVSEKHQIFLCTCRSREGDYFKNNPNVSIFNL